MHELSLCEGILQILEEQSRTQCFTRVHRVCLEIGALASVEPEALRFNFDACPQCGSHQLQVIEGEELRIQQLEVE